MQIGFIGAGKVGVSLGKYFKEKGRAVVGYYSRTETSARWAAEFTDTAYYENLQQIISDCDILMFTVPDDKIAEVYRQAKPYLSGKIIAHCSGLHSSKIFSDIGTADCSAYSIHPLCAVSSKEYSYKLLSDTLFTLEGDNAHISTIQQLFEEMGNRTCVISAENKAKYHAAASLASNHMTAVFYMAEKLFLECGFSEKQAREELYGLAKGNLENILAQGCIASLTGPIERGDGATVEKHLDCLPEEIRSAYLENGKQLVEIAEKKHPKRDNSRIKNLLERKSEKYEEHRTYLTETERRKR